VHVDTRSSVSPLSVVLRFVRNLHVSMKGYENYGLRIWGSYHLLLSGRRTPRRNARLLLLTSLCEKRNNACHFDWCEAVTLCSCCCAGDGAQKCGRTEDCTRLAACSPKTHINVLVMFLLCFDVGSACVGFRDVVRVDNTSVGPSKAYLHRICTVLLSYLAFSVFMLNNSHGDSFIAILTH
jgi:hypothetical protein